MPHKWHKQNTKFPSDGNCVFTPRGEAFQSIIWQWSLVTPYPHEKTRLRKNWAENREQIFVAAPMAVDDILKWPIQNDFKKKIILRPETLKTGAANIFQAMPTSTSRAVPQPRRAAPPSSTPQSEASTPLPRPLFLHTLQYFLSRNPSRLWLSDHRDFRAIELLSPNPHPYPSVTPDPLLQPALTVQIMFQIHPRSHLEAKQSNFRSAPEVTERNGRRSGLPPASGSPSALKGNFRPHEVNFRSEYSTRRIASSWRRHSSLAGRPSAGPAAALAEGAILRPRSNFRSLQEGDVRAKRLVSLGF